jgi:heme/copper-type cytochrome/quinol oxidase subunit 2
METKNLLIGLGVLVLIGVGAWFIMEKDVATTSQIPVDSAMPAQGSDTSEMEVAGSQDSVVSPAAPASVDTNFIKEFVMSAYYDEKGKWFSLNEIVVKKGDTVRVHITNTAGMHDFTIDELGIKKELPLDQEVVVEFVADKVGDFVYYCSMPGHRVGGQWGTLRVTE